MIQKIDSMWFPGRNKKKIKLAECHIFGSGRYFIRKWMISWKIYRENVLWKMNQILNSLFLEMKWNKNPREIHSLYETELFQFSSICE